MQIRLLGPVDVVSGGIERPVPGTRRKALLAVLALHAGEIVSADRLVDIVWANEPPQTAPNTLQSHMSHLRGILGSRTAIVARAPGYVLNLSAEATDVLTAERLIRHARQATDPAETATRLRAALDLWRGRALADVAGISWLDQQSDRLERLRLEVVQGLVDARLALGEHAQLVPELERLTRQHQFDEHLYGQLMLALYRAGRQADALATYQRLRQILGEELGIDPSVELRNLEAAVLRQDPTLALSPSVAASVTEGHPAPAPAERAAWPPPAQLPVALGTFAARRSELSWLDEAIPADPLAGLTAAIAVISGTAGVGKTTLAVHWGRKSADQFPDGQLYVNLRGFAPAGSALEPAEVLRDFLTALGVPAHQIPAGVEPRAALYRSLLSGKRVLVVLDNARDADHVRPLLPAAAGSMAIVTSRDGLASLVAVEGARRLVLNVLTTDEARELIIERLGPDQVSAAAGAVEQIILRCARLPLALAIVSTRPDVDLRDVAAELAEAPDALDALDAGDPTVDVRAVFSWSYHALSVGAARLFRLLGVHPGADITAPVAASLAAISPREALAALRELERASLLSQYRPGRYSSHDLLRAYAVGLSNTVDGAPDREAAALRLVDHYVHTARRADWLINPHRPSVHCGDPVAGTTPHPLTDPAASWAWLEAEAPSLTAVQRFAADLGWNRHVWHMAWATCTFYQRQGRPHDLFQSWQLGVAAAERLGDYDLRVHAHVFRAEGAARLRDFTQADRDLGAALALTIEHDDRVRQSDVHWTLARNWSRRQRDDLALEYATRALRLVDDAEHLNERIALTNAVGWYAALTGQHALAQAQLETALELARAHRRPVTEAHALDSLGFLALRSGQPAQAQQLLTQSLLLARDNGDAVSEANVLEHLGDAGAALHDEGSARNRWSMAARLYQEQHRTAEAEAVERKISLLDRRPPRPVPVLVRRRRAARV